MLGSVCEARYTECVSGYPNYYAILGVTPEFTATAIRRAYRDRMLKQRKHPDLGGATEEAILLNEAYAVLKEPARRADYDRLYLEQIATIPPPSTAYTVAAERRGLVRQAYAGHIAVQRPHERFGHPGQCRDISEGGLSFRTLSPLHAGDLLIINFAQDPGLELHGSLRWHRVIPQRFGTPLYEGGIKFTDVDLSRFQQFCERVGLRNL